MATTAYENARKKTDSVLLGGVKIVFPAFDDLPEKTLFWGTAGFEAADGDEYRSALTAVPNCSTRDGSAKDYADFTVNDVDAAWYEIVKPYEEVFEDSRVTVSEFLKTADDVYESEILLEGFIEKFSLNESNYTLSFGCISDMSRLGSPMGGRILSLRYCAAPKFNYMGLESPLVNICCWQMGQGGNPLFCTRKRTGPDGCEDHWNDHRFFAVEGLTSAEIKYVAGGGIGGGGWNYGGGNCFTPETLVWMADGSSKPIWRVKVGDYVMSFTPDARLVKRQVLKTFRSVSDYKLNLDFGKSRSVGTKDEHLFLIGKDLFLPADELKSGSTVRGRRDAQPDGVWIDLMVRSFYRNSGKFRFCNFHVHDTMMYFIVLADGTKIGVSNLKDVYASNYPEVMQ